mgnify:CR=1 FL=1
MDCSQATCPLEPADATTFEDCVCATNCRGAVMIAQCAVGYRQCDQSCVPLMQTGCPSSCYLNVSLGSSRLGWALNLTLELRGKGWQSCSQVSSSLWE